MSNTKIVIYSPNQRVVVTKKTLSDAVHAYSRTNVEATLSASKTLSDNAFKLFVRMNLHQDDFQYALSPVAIKNEIGMSAGKYRSAVNELIKKGYLVLVQGKKNLFDFYEYPQKDYTDNIVRVPSELTVEQVADAEGHGADPVDHVIDTRTSSAENREMDNQIQHDDEADSNGEINQDIPRDTIKDNEEDIPYHTEENVIEDVVKSIMLSHEQSFQALLDKRKKEQQREQERRDYEAILSCVDPDDRCYFDHMNPDRDSPFGLPDDGIDWDDPGLPF